MALFKLINGQSGIESGSLIHAAEADIELEKHLESWLESSPWAIAQEPLLIIARQPTAITEAQKRYPDLMGLDKNGNLVVIELKKSQTPRDVVAQILEYAAWANELSEGDVFHMAEEYYKDGRTESPDIGRIFCDTFETDEMPTLNNQLRLFVAGEEVTPGVARVCRFLRTSHGIDISCIEFAVYRTETGEVLVASSVIVGQEEAKTPRSPGDRWRGEKRVRDIIYEAVLSYTGGDPSKHFAPRDIAALILSQYPEFKKNNVGAQVIADCVNHTSRHHYPSGKDLYWWIAKGEYKLYESDKDKTPETQ